MARHQLAQQTMFTARCTCGAMAFGFRPWTDAAYVLLRFHLSPTQVVKVRIR